MQIAVRQADTAGLGPAALEHGSKAEAGAVYVYERQEHFAQLADNVAGLGYTAVDGRNSMPDPSCVAAVVSAGFDPELRLASELAQICPVLLVSDNTSFDYRLAATRAGVKAVLWPPVDIVELGAWLADFDENSGSPQTILIVDDDELAAASYAAALQSAGMRAHIVTDPRLAPEKVGALAPDLVLLDLDMPAASGVEVAQILRQTRANLSLPIVFLSAERDEARRHAARRIGGDDFISKPVDLARLPAMVRMRAERAIALRQVMERDSLTGLLNHAVFKDRLVSELRRSDRSGAQLSLCLIDIDHFKRVNDTHGHQVGDRVIKMLAQSLTVWVRRSDVVARYGGEEFAILFMDTPQQAALAAVEKIRRRFSQIVFDAEDGNFSVTLSAGLAGSSEKDSAEELISAADEALYGAKEAGRNRIVAASISPAQE